jgi:hypothetical protein|tara:strand:- start:2693 stop:3079 length:387 start_codon:yes stop_codon:yes gene_type:complete
MDIKEEIANRAPTLRSKRVIWFLLLGAPAACALVAFLNPVTLELNAKELRWLQIYIAGTMTFCTSLYLNYHYYRWSKLITKFHNEISPLMATAIESAGSEIATKILSSSSRENLIATLQSYQSKNPNK